MNGKEIIKILKKEGWIILRINGSHYRLGKGSARTTIPVHGNRDIGESVLKSIIRQTGVKL
jgi:predicted RNA binding protein YcfA (HicA-like mRNA interferase family)